MTEEEVLDFFEKLRSQRQELQSLIQERENVASDLASVKAVQYDKPKITVSANSDLAQVLEKIIERCEELDKRLASCMKTLTDMRKEAYALLALCNDSRDKAVLYDRYLVGMSWTQLEKKYGRTRQRLDYVRRRAIHVISRKSR
nr:MAG TPA: Protein of unknown function (DUF1492) [Caudoviricetes sp.]